MRIAAKFAVVPLVFALGLGLGLPAPALSAAPAAPARAAAVDIPYQQFTLPNGLRVIVHTDRKAPIVAVNLWYHVGSKDEPAGRTGFAHLFEHLMFNGSENNRGEYFPPFEAVGATDQNGTTNQDRTNYFQNVPTTALDMALWMESDRMGHLLGAIDQKTLDEQRGVVQNEKRQSENQPYGQVWEALGRAMYPAGHPYHHSVIGSMNDLNAATLDDVKNWFRAWYGPNNAVLVLAGDIDLATAKEKVARYFGDIPASPTMAQPRVDIARRTGHTRSVLQDKVPQTRIYRVWNVPQYGTRDGDLLQLLGQILYGSRVSRLDRRLVMGDQIASNVTGMSSGSQLGGQFMIIANVKPGVDPAKVEAAIDEELRRLVNEGPTQAELDQAKTALRAGVIRGLERIGGFGGKADSLAECAVFTGNPGCLRSTLTHLQRATVADLRRVGRQWLSDGDHTLLVTPGERTAAAEEPSVRPAPFTLPRPDPKYTTTPGVDRSGGVQIPSQFPALTFPALQRATLSNGTQVVLAQRHDIPVVQMSYQFGGGYASDAAGGKPGVASFATGMLDEGAGERDTQAFGNRAESLGASYGAGADLDGASVGMNALSENLEPSLALFADMLRAPRFDATEMERVRAQWLAGIAQEKANPRALVRRLQGPLLFGAGHPYGVPLTGSGTEAAIAALTRDDLLAYHRRHIRPEGATLIVVGDTTLAQLVPLLEKYLGDWRGEGPAPAAAPLAAVAAPTKPRVYLVNQPGALQSTIYASLLLPPTTAPGLTPLNMANDVLGGEFSSRLNMNLREDKHWAYGAYSGAGSALGQRLWSAQASVQTDKTRESLAEMLREMTEYASGQRPPTPAELTRLKASDIRGLPGAYETGSAVASTIASIVRYNRPDDYVQRRVAEVEALTPAQVAEAARRFDPNALTWIIVGDLSKIEAGVRALNLGEVVVLDADGKPVAGR